MLLFGLGNHGKHFTATRHNAGCDAVDKAACAFHLSWKRAPFHKYVFALHKEADASVYSPLIFCKSVTYMNHSGNVVPMLRRRFSLAPHNMCVVLDNMDLPLGKIRLKMKGGNAGHNGLRSFAAALKTQNFPRIYIGVGRPKTDAVEHVLGRFNYAEQCILDDLLRQFAALCKKLPFTPLEHLVQQINSLSVT